MARFYSHLPQRLQQIISQQKIFFVSTAPETGRLSLSPKGMDSFLCLSENQVAFLNVTGSGNETAAHLLENGRVTVMFCSFTEKPLILRIYGFGEAIYPTDPRWDALHPQFKPLPGARQIILIQVESVQTSCGESIPFFEYKGERETLNKWATQKGPDGLNEYQTKNNQISIDGLSTGLPEP